MEVSPSQIKANPLKKQIWAEGSYFDKPLLIQTNPLKKQIWAEPSDEGVSLTYFDNPFQDQGLRGIELSPIQSKLIPGEGRSGLNPQTRELL